MSEYGELWMLGIAVASGVIPWAFSIHAKVSVIAATIKSLPLMVDEIRNTLKDHDRRLNTHEEHIAVLRATSGLGDRRGGK